MSCLCSTGDDQLDQTYEVARRALQEAAECPEPEEQDCELVGVFIYNAMSITFPKLFTEKGPEQLVHSNRTTIMF